MIADVHWHRGTKRWGAWLVAVALLQLPSSSQAGTNAEDLITQSIELRKSNRDHEALPLLLKAVQMQPSPRAYAHLGTCEQALGLWVSAEAHLMESLGNPSDPWIQKNEPELAKALDFVQSKIGSIEIWGGPEGARVSIDGESIGTLPMRAPARVPVGTRTLSVDLPGYFSEKRPIEIRAGKLANREHVALRPLTPSGESPAVATQPPVENAPPPPNEPAGSSAEHPVYRRWWFWTALGAIVVGSGASIFLLTRSNQSCVEPKGGTCTKF